MALASITTKSRQSITACAHFLFLPITCFDLFLTQLSSPAVNHKSNKQENIKSAPTASLNGMLLMSMSLSCEYLK